jgi:GNAT superfamily N-acetyltransferase
MLVEIVKLNQDNLAAEHICCAIADKKCLEGYRLKKEWLKSQLDFGYTFKKYDVRHKVFIEYAPAENAWAPIDAPGYLLINCFWVAGSYKGQGYGQKLLQECLDDAKNKNGVAVISSNKKRPFLSDKAFFLKNGFVLCDTAPPYFELLAKRFNDADWPKFREKAKKGRYENEEGLKIIYTNQCPYTEYYVNEIMEAAGEHGIPFQKVKLDRREDARDLHTAWSMYSVFYNGEFVTHELLTRNRFEKLWNTIKK